IFHHGRQCLASRNTLVIVWTPLTVATKFRLILATRQRWCAEATRCLSGSGITFTRLGAGTRQRLGIGKTRFASRAKFAPPVLSHLLRGLVHAGAKLRHILIAFNLRSQALG